MAGRLIDQMVADGAVAVAAFVAAVRSREPVGICDCGSWMTGRIDRTKRLTFYVAECARCGDEVCAPEGRINRSATARTRPTVPAPAAEHEIAAWRERDLALLGERDD